MIVRTCQIRRCRDLAVCGVGPRPVFVCAAHLDEYLAALERCVARAVAEIGGAGPRFDELALEA